MNNLQFQLSIIRDIVLTLPRVAEETYFLQTRKVRKDVLQTVTP